MLSILRRSTGRGAVVVAILFVLAIVAACSSGAALAPAGGGAAPGASAGAAGGSAPGRGLSGEPLPGDQDGTGGSGNGTGSGVPQAAPGEQGLLIIKNGTMSLQVAGLDQAVDKATQQITALGGYVSGSDRSGDDDSATAAVTFRIPAARWDEALAGLRGMAVKVLAERSTTEDVTTQVVDLGARISNLQATERALQGIMDKATAIKDVLAVQAELTTVRGQIEQMTAEKNHLVQQAAMSTLAVTFELKPNPVKTEQQQFDPAAEAERASANLVSGLQGLATAGIWFAIVWVPALLFLGVVLGLVYLGFRRVRRMGDGGGGPSEPIEPVAEGGA
jgi:Domain of unknown function (DUF4349)